MTDNIETRFDEIRTKSNGIIKGIDDAVKGESSDVMRDNFSLKPSENVSFESVSKYGLRLGLPTRDFLEGYRLRVARDYNNNPNLKVLEYFSGVVRGSNPFAVVLANQMSNEEGYRTVSQADLENARKAGFDFKKTYMDTSLVLRTLEDSFSNNSLIAKDLAYQLEERGAEFSSESPLVIPLNQLTLHNADNFYGLSFKLKDDAEFFNAPILNSVYSGSRFNSNNIDMKTGLPKKVKRGDRTLYTNASGLSRLFLDDFLSVDSEMRNLACSRDIRRIRFMRDSEK